MNILRSSHSRLFDNQVDQRLDLAVAVVELMGDIRDASTAIAGFEGHRFASEHNPDPARGEIHVFDRAADMSGERACQLACRNRIAKEFHFASRLSWSEAVPFGAALGVDEVRPLGGAYDVDASGRLGAAVRKSGHRQA